MSSHISEESDEDTIKTCEPDKATTKIIKWKERGLQLAFVFDYVLEKYQRRINRYALLGFLASLIATGTSLSNLGVSEEDYPDLAMGLKVSGVATALVTNYCTGVIKIMGWSDLVKNSQKYSQSVESFVSSITLELESLNPKPGKFIADNRDKYSSILKSVPDIPQSDYLKALEQYKQSKSRFKNDLILV